MTDVTRTAVFRETKVRKHLKQDASWINRFQEEQEPPADVQARKPIKQAKPVNVPSPVGSPVTSSSLQSSSPQKSSYVTSAIKKFDLQHVPEDSKKIQKEEEERTSTVKPVEEPPAGAPTKTEAEKPIVSPSEAAHTTSSEAPVNNVVEEPLKTSTLSPESNVLSETVATPSEDPKKASVDAPVNIEEKTIDDGTTKKPLKASETIESIVIEKSEVNASVEALKTTTDVPLKDIAEKPVENPVEESPKTTATTEIKESVVIASEETPTTSPGVPLKDIAEKPVENLVKELPKTTATTKIKESVVNASVEALKTTTDVPLKDIAEKPVENLVKESPKITTTTEIKESVVRASEETPTTSPGVPLKDIAEKPVENPVKESPKITTTTEIKESVVRASEETPTTSPGVPLKVIAEKPVENLVKELPKTTATTEIKESVVNASVEALKTTTDVPLKGIAEKPTTVEVHVEDLVKDSLKKTHQLLEEEPEIKPPHEPKTVGTEKSGDTALSEPLKAPEACVIPLVILTNEALKVSSGILKEDEGVKQTKKPEMEPIKTLSEAPQIDIVEEAQVKIAEETQKRSTNTLKKDVVEISVLKSSEEPQKTPEKHTVEKLEAKPVVEPLNPPAVDPKKDMLEKLLDKPAAKTPEIPSQSIVVEKVTIEAQTTTLESSQKDEVEKTFISSEAALKTPPEATKKDDTEKPTNNHANETAKTPEDDVKKEIPVVKPVEVPLDCALVVKAIEEPLSKSLEEPLKTQSGDSKEHGVENSDVKLILEPIRTSTDVPKAGTGIAPVPQELIAKTRDDNPSKLNTEVTTASEPPGEAEKVDPGELSLGSALEATHSSEASDPIQEPLVAAENCNLKSEAPLTVNGKATCSFCKLPFDGNVKLSLNIPEICCHPDCFKCNDCSAPLGDLSSPMFHHSGKVLCEKCFDRIFQI
ncbi:hypothetical protein DNTS_016492 [Danionella cerebrum]|uniref:LIM zinc-binding domain-containing protein n=1 Tax=Danionella cerebrum TaxID=2873325 RepID=A0A553RIR4_9TELE|nr:hypothetical protein DNTS_016492 [Danionella translucida]